MYPFVSLPHRLFDMNYTLCYFPVSSCYHSFFAAIGRVGAILGNVMFGELIDYSAAIPLFVTAATMLIAAIAAGFTPETKHINLA